MLPDKDKIGLRDEEHELNAELAGNYAYNHGETTVTVAKFYESPSAIKGQ